MKTIETLVVITTLVACSAAAAVSEAGQLESACDFDYDCVDPLICLSHQCVTNYCIPELSRLEHASCTPTLHGYNFECNYGYEYIIETDKCEPIRSSDTGVEGTNCTTSRDCLESLRCIMNGCFDPCDSFGPSDHGDCKVVNHEMELTCHRGYEKIASVFCSRMSQYACKSDRYCLPTHSCDLHGDCVDPCLKSSIEFVNGDCAVKDHEIVIACHAGFEPIPCSFTCEKIVANDSGTEGKQCSTATDCMSSLTCSDGQCVDPCNEWPTEDRRQCITVNHIARSVGQCGYQ